MVICPLVTPYEDGCSPVLAQPAWRPSSMSVQARHRGPVLPGASPRHHLLLRGGPPSETALPEYPATRRRRRGERRTYRGLPEHHPQQHQGTKEGDSRPATLPDIHPVILSFSHFSLYPCSALSSFLLPCHPYISSLFPPFMHCLSILPL